MTGNCVASYPEGGRDTGQNTGRDTGRGTGPSHYLLPLILRSFLLTARSTCKHELFLASWRPAVSRAAPISLIMAVC